MSPGSGSDPASDPRMASGPSDDSAGIQQQLQATTLFAGIDISEGGIKGALRRLSASRHIPPRTGVLESGAPGAEGTESPEPFPTSSVPPTPSVSVPQHGLDGTVRLYLGSCLSRALRSPEAWGDLRGCAVATLVEVVEHLDQPLLEWVDVGPLLDLDPPRSGHGTPPSRSKTHWLFKSRSFPGCISGVVACSPQASA